ncbi:hypothetical protein VOLCADRAFT_88115 [Volvox carteri f. nagariensis]|uniref:Uncharacterized protein n=1 Tax=Volvox carteri f. nagariensis TaxID=3068 RepID=D8TNB5_VOLCA|nr:uncharacterized protein VOLCADRAFT_88115 [Volvox carteri f. nagariensis]EFJ50961.1 hypothetical protein VOLCADRAFT_88115 [Volvox carteri f. nagariensis]|eukprot:XP_002947973.1 hypothetical protein VOLCADRAFT_88115 [Volvox carteri f. nagariensis]
MSSASHLPGVPEAQPAPSLLLNNANDAGRPPSHLIGACSVVAVVPRSLAKARREALTSFAAAADSQQSEPILHRQTLAQPPGFEEFQLSWYAQAAVVCQPEPATAAAAFSAAATAASATEPSSHIAGGSGGKRRGRRSAAVGRSCGDGGGASSGGGGDGGGDGTCTARLCYTYEGSPSGMSEPAERGVKRAPWDEYGIELLEVTSAGNSGQGVLLYGHTSSLHVGVLPPWRLTHVVLGLFLDARPLQALQSQLALVGDFRPLPRRLAELGPPVEMQLVQAALTGALANAKEQLHTAIMTHGSAAAAFHTGSFLMGRLEVQLTATVPVLVDSLSSIIKRACNPNLASYACRLLDCKASGLSDALYGKLYDNITQHVTAGVEAKEAAKMRRKRTRGQGGGHATAGAPAEDVGTGDGICGDCGRPPYELLPEGGDMLLLEASGNGPEEDTAVGEWTSYRDGDKVLHGGWDTYMSAQAGDGVVAPGKEEDTRANWINNISILRSRTVDS